jgi:ribonuclease HI
MRFFSKTFFQLARTIYKNYSRLEIYTDGSSKDGFGSWAYLISRHGKCISEKAGRIRCANSNTMEFQAAIEALQALPESSNITLFTDSKILVDTMTFGKGHSSFQTQIDSLLQLTQKHHIQWKWIKAHNGNKFNERCDELCTLIRGTSPYRSGR